MRFICCFMLMLAIVPAWSQRKDKTKVFITRITLMDKKHVRGVIYELREGSIRMAVIEKKDTAFQEIGITNIRKITSHRKGVMASTIIGGMAAGAMVGLATYEEPDCDVFCFDFGPEMPMGIGAGIGGIIGVSVGIALHQTFKVNASLDTYEQLRPKLVKYCYRCR